MRTYCNNDRETLNLVKINKGSLNLSDWALPTAAKSHSENF